LRDRDDRVFLGDLVQPTTLPGVMVIPNGTFVDNPGELIVPEQDLVGEAAKLADVVVIDAGPVLSVNDPIALAPHVDSVVIVARAGRTTGDLAARAAQLLARADAPIAGVALIGVPRSASSQPYYAQQRSRPLNQTWRRLRSDQWKTRSTTENSPQSSDAGEDISSSH
jgi:hypothetical protein